MREVIAQYNDVITEQTPFREYAQLIREIVTAPTLAGLKKALNAGNAASKYPIGTEIEDEWNGQSNPLIVAHYTDITLANSSVKPGVYLVRKWVEPTGVKFDSAGSNIYSASSIETYLTNDYFSACSNALKNVVTEIKIESRNTSKVVLINAKFFLMSDTEVYADRSGIIEGIAWDYWKQRTGLPSPGYASNTGRIMQTRSGVATSTWLRTQRDSTSSDVLWIGVGGSIYGTSPNRSNGGGVLPACAIIAD